MKKVLLFAVIGLGVIATSCKKDYICECEITTSGTDLFGDVLAATTTSSSTTITAKKKDAEATCNSGNSSTSFFGQTIESKCELK